MMLKKIYINNKPLFLVSEINDEVNEYLHHEETVFIDEYNHHTVKAMIHEMEAPQIRTGVFLHRDVEALLNGFKKRLHVVMAAGGLVYTLSGELLLIYRHGKWDLPKGKVDANEKLSTCALRETREETGMEDLEVEASLYPTWHTYHLNGKHLLKETHWFLMKGNRFNQLSPQIEEGIEKCEWVHFEKIAPYVEHTYSLVRELVWQAIKMIQEKNSI